jgi:amino acid permease
MGEIVILFLLIILSTEAVYSMFIKNSFKDLISSFKNEEFYWGVDLRIFLGRWLAILALIFVVIRMCAKYL